MNLNNNQKNQLNKCLEVIQNLLGADFLGMYLYGSSLVGGLKKYSDIDLLVVINRSTTQQEKITLVEKLLKISGIYMKGDASPLDITFVQKSDINPWHYPPRFDFQYGEWLREAFENKNYEPWQNYEMSDLAIIITQVLLKNYALYGPLAQELLPTIPPQDFTTAMLQDLDRLYQDLESDTRNVLLTYARIWYSVETHVITSKSQAATWSLEQLPQNCQLPLNRALAIYKGQESEHWDDIQSLTKTCALFMLNAIKKNTKSDISNQPITLR